MHPNERLGMQKQRLQNLERATHQFRMGGGRNSLHADFQTARGQHTTTQGSTRRLLDHDVERFVRLPKPFSERGNFERARAGFPDQNLEARTSFRVVGSGEIISGSEQRRRRERVEQRPLHHARTCNVGNARFEFLLFCRNFKQLCDLRITTPRAGRAPRKQNFSSGLREQSREPDDLFVRLRCDGQRFAEQIRGCMKVFRERRIRFGLTDISASAPTRLQCVVQLGFCGECISQCRERVFGR
jgi:hypothetical protein